MDMHEPHLFGSDFHMPTQRQSERHGSAHVRGPVKQQSNNLSYQWIIR
jgi:hypothetical protein